MFERQHEIFYYITVGNENYVMPAMPDGAEDGIVRGIYKFRRGEGKRNWPRVHLFGSGAILNEALRAQEILAERFKVSAEVWSVTSYQQLRREALIIDRWNRLHPTQRPRKPYFVKQLDGEPYPIVAASDYVKLVADQVTPWAPAGLTALGTDGFGRSEARTELRRFYEVDAESITVAALHALSRRGELDPHVIEKALCDFAVNPERPDPARS